MSDKLPIEIKKQNIIKQMFNYIKGLFKCKDDIKIIEKTSVVPKESKTTEIYKVHNLDKVNAEVIKNVNRKNKLEEIIQIIEKNPEALDKLDIQKLEIIDNYYKEKIIEFKKRYNLL